MQRAFAVGDLHLVGSTPEAVVRDFERLLAGVRGERVFVLGDLFDLSSEEPEAPPERALAGVLDRHPGVRRALGGHLEAGGELVLVSGNHDACVGAGSFRGTLAAALDLSLAARARLLTTPWLHREGGLHVEHGHLYDPDNAPDHPLAPGDDALGVRFVKDFIAPTGAHRYLHANDRTPLELFLSAFRWYGPRGPHVVYRYFHTAFRAVAASGPLRRAPADGAGALDAFLAETGLERRTAELCLGLAATPTMRSLRRTVSRLYFDRVLATTGLLASGAAAAAGRRRAAASLFGVSALAMGVSWAAGHDRFGGTVPKRLGDAANRVADATGADLVVFGHTHREALEDRYANTGSFSFPGPGAPGRPYLELDLAGRPRAVRRYLARAEPDAT